ncbi:hypothetical protein LEN26_017225 [Aphanomyces euteiches]|nr:hypothetical protein LEN26_017225 [Aphanomyces euteiches]KAH9128536.1 hypothetical protein AeMF1_001323 [Aphanomyces euteiches]KAH9192238.1 hypothetical protein AeNC1_005794 [Aphanomyces euteiches]
MKSSAVVVIVSMVSTIAGQRSDPNAINKCTSAVQDIISKATTNPQAQTCSTDSGVKSLTTLATTGLKADDSKKIALTASCKTWFTGVSGSIKAKTPACDFYDPKTGTAGKPSTSNTAKFKWNFQDFIRDAHRVKPAAAKPKTTVKPSTSKPKTTAKPGATPSATPSSTSSKTTTAAPSGTPAATKASSPATPAPTVKATPVPVTKNTIAPLTTKKKLLR